MDDETIQQLSIVSQNEFQLKGAWYFRWYCGATKTQLSTFNTGFSIRCEKPTSFQPVTRPNV